MTTGEFSRLMWNLKDDCRREPVRLVAERHSSLKIRQVDALMGFMVKHALASYYINALIKRISNEE